MPSKNPTLLSPNESHIDFVMKRILILSIAPLFFASCVPKELTGDTVSRDEVGQTQNIQRGTVTSVRYVKIQGGSTAGSIIGGIAGGVLGSEVGGGSGRKAATIGGAGIGAAAGGAAEQKLMNRQGIELNIELDDGETVSITQQHTERESFSAGDRVRVIYGSGRTRVSH